MPSKSKAKLAKDVELHGEDIRDLQVSQQEVHKYLKVLNDHVTAITNTQDRLANHQRYLAGDIRVLMDHQVLLTHQINRHSLRLNQINDVMNKLRHTFPAQPHEEEDFSDTQSNSEAPLGLARMRPSGNISDLTATEQREHNTMVATADEEDQECHAKPLEDQSAQVASKMTTLKCDEGTTLKNDVHPAIETATEDERETTVDNQDSTSESGIEIPSEECHNEDFHYQHDLADISTTLAVAPRRQSEPDLGPSPRFGRCREYPDRCVRRHPSTTAIPELTVIQRVSS